MPSLRVRLGDGTKSRYSLVPFPIANVGHVTALPDMSQLDKLLTIAAQENKLIKHELEIMGQDLTFWSKPLKIEEYQMAADAAKNPNNQLEVTARLFIMKALDQAGRPQYAVDALPVLMKELSLETAARIMRAMDDKEEDQSMESLDMKSDQAAAKKGKRADG